MTGFSLGGRLAPIGLSVSFLKQSLRDVRTTLVDWRRHELCQQIDVSGPAPFPDCTALLDPFEARWTTEVLIDCGEWTTYLNNGLNGGDPTAAAPYLATRLGCDAVVAVHVLSSRAGHASTQLCMIGPRGAPPLMYVRTIAVHAEDRRWSWHTSGEILPFERPNRYAARRISDRFDRTLLVEYLCAIGIRVDDGDFFGDGFGVRQNVGP